MLQKIFKRGFGLLAVIQVVAIDLRDGEKGFSAVLASGIFTAQKDQLANCIFEALGIVQNAALVAQQLSHGEHAFVGLGRGWRSVIDLAVGLNYFLEITAGTLRF